MPLDLRLVQALYDPVYDVLLTFISVQRKAGFSQQIGQFQLPEDGQLSGAARVPGTGGAVDDDMVALDCDDPPVAGHSPGRRIQVPLANNDIVLFKKKVVSLDLMTQPLIIIQIAFDFVARQEIGRASCRERVSSEV